MTKEQEERIFAEDEMQLAAIQSDWDEEALLKQQSIFFLKDVVKILNVDAHQVKRRARQLEQKGKSPWTVMGVRKVWNHWIVRMTIFGPYYKRHLKPKLRSLDPEWDGNRLLQEKGLFAMTDVCKLIPFSANQLRYQAKKRKNPREDIGIWKDTKLNLFVVDMERFAPWITKQWAQAGQKVG